MSENYGKCSNKMDVPGDFNRTIAGDIYNDGDFFKGRVWIPGIRIPAVN